MPAIADRAVAARHLANRWAWGRASYSSGRDLESFTNFLAEKTGQRGSAPVKETAVVELTEASFDRIVLDSSKDVLVEFYAPCTARGPTLL